MAGKVLRNSRGQFQGSTKGWGAGRRGGGGGGRSGGGGAKVSGATKTKGGAMPTPQQKAAATRRRNRRKAELKQAFKGAAQGVALGTATIVAAGVAQGIATGAIRPGRAAMNLKGNLANVAKQEWGKQQTLKFGQEYTSQMRGLGATDGILRPRRTRRGVWKVTGM